MSAAPTWFLFSAQPETLTLFNLRGLELKASPRCN